MYDENKYQPYQYGSSPEPNRDENDGVEQHIEHSEERESDVKFEKSIPKYDYSYGAQFSQSNSQKNMETSKKRSGGKRVIAVVALAVVFGVVSSVVFQGTNYVLDNYLGLGGKDAHTPIGTTQIVTGSGESAPSDIADVAENVMPSVVSITNLSIQEVQTFPFGNITQYESWSSGSGIIIGQNNKEVLIVTNNHVVENSKTLTVIWIDGNSTEAVIKGTDKDRDLAVIAVAFSELKAETAEKIKVATLGNSTNLRVGETTIAIGNALGYGQSVTNGIVSALGRELEGIEGTLIQTNAAINPGNSGGALLNAKGEVIGINTAKVNSTSVEGMGYAIPISDVLEILEDLVNQEARVKVPESERGSLGIYGYDIRSDVASVYKVPMGIYVQSLAKGGAAAKAGIPIGCIVIEINNRDVESMAELKEELEYYRSGEEVIVTCCVPTEGKYETKEYKVTLN